MANQVAARLAGDDYQHLYAWWHALGLFLPHLELAEVWIEDERAGSFDDITLHYVPTAQRPSHFLQVKFHVDQFVSSLRLRLGSTNATADVSERAAERMGHLNLRCDDSALLLASGIVRDWVKRGVQKLTLENLNAVIEKFDLRAKPKEPAVTVYLETIKKRRFDLEPDYLLDWRHHFSGPAHEKGHSVVDSAVNSRSVSIWSTPPNSYGLEDFHVSRHGSPSERFFRG
jgi:hypothetical protein